MTLILSALTKTHAIQVSDRRLSDSTGKHFDHMANKAICCSCLDGHYSIAYTGLAEFNGKRTDDWISDTLYELRSTSRLTVEASISYLEARFTEYFSRLHICQEYKALTMALVGVHHRDLDSERRSTTPFLAIISNCEDPSRHHAFEVKDNFKTFVRRLQVNQKKFMCHPSGTTSAIDVALYHRSIRLIRKNILDLDKPWTISTILSEVIRDASHHEENGWRIGRDLMIVSWPYLDESYFVEYSPENKTPYIYAPHWVAATGGLIKGFTFRSDDPEY